MLLFSVLLAAQAASPEPVEVREEAVPIGSITIPPEVVPAVHPYMMCALAAGGQRVEQDDEVIAEAEEGRDCSALRSKALVEGVELLRKQGLGRNKREREDYVEAVLVAVDEFARPKTDAELLEMYEKRQGEVSD